MTKTKCTSRIHMSPSWLQPCVLLSSLNLFSFGQASEMASFVQSKRDLGCKAPQVTILEEGINTDSRWAKEFWTLLGGKAKYRGTPRPSTVVSNTKYRGAVRPCTTEPIQDQVPQHVNTVRHALNSTRC